MSDALDLAAESAEAAQGAVQPDVPSQEAPPPWGEDFNPERAWKTITHLRGREKELESEAKALERLRSGSDPDALREIADAYGFEIPEDDSDVDIPDLEPEDDVRRQVRELAEWREQQEQQKAIDEFRSHVNKLSKDAGLELDDDEVQTVFARSIAKGFTPDATTEAFQWLTGRYSAVEQKAIEKYLQSKSGVPTPPQPGKAGAPQLDPSDRKARQAHFEALIAAEEQQG